MALVPPSSDKLASLLYCSARDLRAACPELEQTLSDTRGLVLMRALRERQDIEGAIGEMVALDPTFGSLRTGWVDFAGAGHEFGPHELPIVLLENVLSGESAGEVLRRFRAFVEKGTSSGEWYGAISGVTISEACEIAPGIDLVPWAEVPDCPQRTLLSGKEYRPGILVGLRPKSNCALRFKLPERRVLFSSAADHPRSAAELSESADIQQRAENVRRAMTAVSGGAVAILGAWLHASELVLRQTLGTALLIGDALNDVAMFGPSIKPAALDAELASTIFNRLEGFHGNDAEVLKTALDRIGFALRQRAMANKAIDLSIALEVLLLHEKNGSKTELSYRSAVRGAHFLGGNKWERLANFKHLKDVYDLRSKAVHSGRISGSAKEEKILEKAVELSVGIARKLIELGRFPKWEEEFVFSFGG